MITFNNSIAITLIICITIIVIARYAITSWKKIEGAKLLNDSNKFTSTIKIDMSILDALDKMIDDIINEFVILKMAPNDIDYISNKQEDELREYVVAEIDKRLSDIMKDKLSIICNEEYVGELIGKRIYFAISNFVLEYNMPGKN